MTADNGKHDHRALETGETVYLTKDPGCNWCINQYDCSWFEGQHLALGGLLLGPRELKTKTVFAQDLGWEDLRFDTEDEAYAFVAKHLGPKQGMFGIEPLLNDRPWDDDRFLIEFVPESGNNIAIVFTGGKVSGPKELIIETYKSSVSLADFIKKSRKAGLSVNVTDLLLIELE